MSDEERHLQRSKLIDDYAIAKADHAALVRQIGSIGDTFQKLGIALEEFATNRTDAAHILPFVFDPPTRQQIQELVDDLRKASKQKSDLYRLLCDMGVELVEK